MSLARSERERLCETALLVGGDAPTLCGDWTVHDLLVHLVVRERDLVASAGIAVPKLAFLTDRAMAARAEVPLADLAAQVEATPWWSPFRLPPVDRLANTLEMLVHHEDIRRAQPDWGPRSLTAAELDEAWGALKLPARGLLRAARTPVRLTRSDTPEASYEIGAGDARPVVVTGEPVELVMFCFGRDQHRGLVFDGDEDAVRRLQDAPKGM